MKKVLLIGLILAICVLAFPQGVMALDTPHEIPINANFAPATVFTATQANPSGGWVWNLAANSPTDNLYTNAMTFSVTTQYEWHVTATDTSPWTGHVNGYMQGDSHNLQNRFQMTVEGAQGTIETAPIIKHGIASASPQPWNANFWQKVVDSDFGSPGGYHITVTYTCTSEF